jgi:hypothetical protein
MPLKLELDSYTLMVAFGKYIVMHALVRLCDRFGSRKFKFVQN